MAQGGGEPGQVVLVVGADDHAIFEEQLVIGEAVAQVAGGEAVAQQEAVELGLVLRAAEPLQEGLERILFFFKAAESGEFTFAWKDDDGSEYTAKSKLTVG